MSIPLETNLPDSSGSLCITQTQTPILECKGCRRDFQSHSSNFQRHFWCTHSKVKGSVKTASEYFSHKLGVLQLVTKWKRMPQPLDGTPLKRPLNIILLKRQEKKEVVFNASLPDENPRKIGFNGIDNGN